MTSYTSTIYTTNPKTVSHPFLYNVLTSQASYPEVNTASIITRAERRVMLAD